MGSRGMIALFAVSIAACACGGGRGDAMEPFVSRDGVYLCLQEQRRKAVHWNLSRSRWSRSLTADGRVQPGHEGGHHEGLNRDRPCALHNAGGV